MGKLLGNILRFVFSWIDGIIASLITMIYKLLSNLSELVLYSDNIIDVIGKRIGLLLGIFMLFKLAISLINYMISPDKLNDKAKGGGKLIINVVVSLALLISINFIFREAYRIQGIVVNSRIIERIFFGNNGIVTSTNDNTADKPKMDIGYYLYTGFFTPNKDVFGDTCDDMWDVSVDINKVKEGQTKSCDDLLYDKLEDDARKSIYNARNSLDMSYVFSDYDLVLATPSARTFAFDYQPIISSAAGVIVLLVLISFSMDLATRAIKLLFLQIIAPIPIISNMDMGKGQEIFKKWGKECINTYLTVFIRLIAINFAVFMIVLLRGNYKSVFVNNVWLNIFLIIGALIFAKQVPKLLEDFLGIKMDGMSLHPLKKFQEQALFGKQITGLAGAGLAGGAAFGANALVGINDFANSKGTGFKNRAKAFANIFGSSIGGMASATTRGTIGALRGQNFGQVYKGAYGGAITARNNRDSRKALDVSAPDVWLNSFQRRLGMYTTAEVQDANVKMYDEFVSSGEAAVSISESEIDKFDNRITIRNFRAGASAADQALIDRITNSTAAGGYGITSLAELREAMNDSSGAYSAKDRAELNAAYNKLRGDIAGKYRERAAATNAADKLDGANSEFRDATGFIYDPNTDTSVLTVKAHVDNAMDIFDRNKQNDVFVRNHITSIDGANIKPVTKQVKYASTSIKNSGAYRQAHKVQEQANKEKK